MTEMGTSPQTIQIIDGESVKKLASGLKLNYQFIFVQMVH
jgi:hypothetical protein